ncbi:ricin-type beta-trefoil lectin domain protein [Photobacterium lucens]|uniref:ricin-type beta-trefoil lectin domain protein n=1 Tax=Photobacterium lucens TaxID=2562949 RepID=UPI00136F7F5C|nr:ricin-type beta-trefoil lectin domain protein [Photobacterium lucens]MBP2701103.1 peptidase [Vibrio parahaemolyticus]MZG56706.1 peptidase [Photobacterium lucens]MZG81708.1 peptidase [Photobacterium lucens]
MKKIILLLPLMSASATAESFDVPHVLSNKALTIRNLTAPMSLPLKQPSNFSAFPTTVNNDPNIAEVYRPQDFTDLGNKTIVNITELTKVAPNSFELKKQPWSDTYWPTVYGGIAWRYHNNKTTSETTFKDLYNYTYKVRPINTYQGDDRNDLSPAEKYDLLVGDKSLSLTKSAWQVGINYGGLNGANIESWMGICNGWASAASVLPRPTNAVTVKDPSGDDLTFYPSDIKALADQLWSEAFMYSQYKVIGARCFKSDPATDNNARVKDSDCRDVNPGVWHIVVLNQLGLSHRSFVLDADYSAQVWNQPAIGYSIEYFNPQTGEKSADPDKVKVARSDYTRDRFSSYRSKNTTSIVGVNMSFKYTDESWPNHKTPDTKADDAVTVVNYTYDLELNDHGDIIGGEWYKQTQHPDFLWTIKKGDTLQSAIDGKGNWNIADPVPTDWQDKAVESSKNAQPLSSIVYTLINAATQNTKPKVQWRPLVTQGQCLNVYNNYTFDGALVLTTKCDGSDNQKWTLTSEGFLHPHNVPQLCFAASNIVKCTNAPEQKWHLDNNKHLINALGQQATFNGQTSPVSATAKGSQWHWGN